MGRGLGDRQREVLAFLKQCWAEGFAPPRSRLMDRFVVDSGTQHRWERRKPTQWATRPQGAYLDTFYPDGLPDPTSPAVAESYRRAVRGLVDRGLVLLVADTDGFYRYADPDAPQPLLLQRDRTGTPRPQQAEPCERPRKPEIPRREQRRQTVLACLPEDGSWVEMTELLAAYLLARGATQADLDALQRQWDAKPHGGNPLLRLQCRRYVIEALQELRHAGKAETGQRDYYYGGEISPRPLRGGGRVDAARRVLPQPQG